MYSGTLTLVIAVDLGCLVEMVVQKASNMLCPMDANEVPVQVQKLTDSTSSTHCSNCEGNRHQEGMKMCHAQGKLYRCCNKLKHFAKCCCFTPHTSVHNFRSGP